MPPSQPDASRGGWTLRQREAFDRGRGTLPGAGVPWLDEFRESAFLQFEEDGLPSPHVEEWRTAPADALSSQPFLPRRRRGAVGIELAPDGRLPRPAVEGGGWVPAIPGVGPSHVIAFADGRHCPDLARPEAHPSEMHGAPRAPSPEPLPPGVSLRSLASLLAEDPDAVRDLIGAPSAFSEHRLSRTTDRRPQSLVALNAAAAADGAVLRVEPGVRVEKPIQIVQASSVGHAFHDDGDPDPENPESPEPRGRRLGSRAHHLRTIISLGEGASADVVEARVGGERDGRPILWTNVVSDIALGEGASLRHVRLDECEDAVLVDVAHARLARNASLTGFVLAGRAGFCRTETRAALEGEGARVRVNGLCLAGGERHVDALTRIDHEAPGGASAQTWRGVLRGSARGGFQGRIRVLPGAGGTDARMDSRNLLLDPGARAESKPELEILTDDVACSHASATGALGADALFYLRSRGVPEAEAEELLVKAFAEAALEGIAAGDGEPDPVADLVRARVRAAMSGGEGEWSAGGGDDG